jgi:hypothetical protein
MLFFRPPPYTAAATFQMPRQLRQLFGTLLLHNNLANPASLWEKFVSDFTMDFGRRDGGRDWIAPENPPQRHRDEALAELELFLQENGRSLKDFPPMPLPPCLHQIRVDRYVNEQRPTEQEQQASQAAWQTRRSAMNASQKRCFDTIVAAFENHLQPNGCPLPRIFFIDSPGG